VLTIDTDAWKTWRAYAIESIPARRVDRALVQKRSGVDCIFLGPRSPRCSAASVPLIRMPRVTGTDFDRRSTAGEGAHRVRGFGALRRPAGLVKRGPICRCRFRLGAQVAAEYYLFAFAAMREIETVSLRYFNVFGPRQDPHSEYSAVIPRFITAMLSGAQPIVYGDGHQSRDFTYVENIVRANLLAATAAGASGRVLNVAAGGKISLLELIAALNKLLKLNVALVPRLGRASLFCMNCIWKPKEAACLPRTH
jgi:hypothetical protein